MTDIKNVLMTNYLPYAKGTIIARAVPGIDGLKPVMRRVLYTMYTMGLTNKKAKSVKIVGTTMNLHPHGDGAIYETEVRMTTGHEALLLPYIESKGSFGKAYSRDMAYAAARYTEAGLTTMHKELFDGINEDAVDFIPNYDNTVKEPVLLPVKFPSVLVNTSSGIAVGTSSSIPSYNLKAVCYATKGIIEKTITSIEELADVLEAPDFATGGYIHGSRESYESLIRTGKGSVSVSGSVNLSNDKITITEVPFRTTVEVILEEVTEHAKSGELKEVADAKDQTDLKGLRAVIYLKRGSNPREVLKKLNRHTRLRTQVSFVTRVIIDGRCVELGIFELLEEWIKFRRETIKRMYIYKNEKRNEQKHLLEAWEKIKVDVKEVALMITNNKEAAAFENLKSTYGMDDLQADYLLGMRVKELTQDGLIKKLNELNIAREDIKVINRVIDSDKEKDNIIVSELMEVANKYGTERKTIMTDPIIETDDNDTQEEIEDMNVSIVVTKRGYLKRLITLKDEMSFACAEDDEERFRIACSNRDSIIIFTYSGMCYKIPAYMIDSSKGIPRDYIFNIVEKSDDSEIAHVASTSDYSESINVVYSNGRGAKVKFDRVAGNRSKYKGLFEEGEPGKLWITKENKFFVITRQKRAAYIDLELMDKIGTRSAFKVARISSDDTIFGVQPLLNVPDKDNVELTKYSKGYCIKIKERLW